MSGKGNRTNHPGHEPTDKTRAEVYALTSFGNTQEEIAKYLGITVDTMAKHYRAEMDSAVIRANAAVARALYNKATAQDDLSAQIFWLKTRARWRERDKDDIDSKTAVEMLLNLLVEKNK
jgi:DNA-binding CsgD family transcriptional regulator